MGAYNTGSVLALDSGQHSPPQLMDLMQFNLSRWRIDLHCHIYCGAADVNNGLITNQASVTADDVTSENNQVSKISDNNNDFDGNTVNDPTEVKLTFDGKIDASKS